MGLFLLLQTENCCQGNKITCSSLTLLQADICEKYGTLVSVNTNLTWYA